MRLSSRVGAFEITEEEVRLAVVSTGGSLPTLLEFHTASLTYASDEERHSAQVDGIKRILAAVKARPALYVLCLNSQTTVVRTLTVPFRGRTRVSAAVPVELEPNLAFSIDDLIIDYSVIREGPAETEVLAVAVKQSLIEEQIGPLAEAGVGIEGVNLDAAGLATLWLAGQRKPTGLHAQLHVRDASAILTIVHNRSLVYFRHVPITAGRFLSNVPAASRDTRNTLRAFATSWQRDETVVDITVTGIDLDAAAREQFEDGLSVPVIYGDLANHVRGAEKAFQRFRAVIEAAPLENAPSALLDHNRWEAAAGVAVAAAGGGIAYELRKGPLAPANPMRGLSGRLAGTAVLALVTLASAAGYCAAQYRNNRAEIEHIGNQVWTIYTETFPEHASEQRPDDDTGGTLSMAMLDEAYTKAVEGGTRVSAGMLTRPPFLDILHELSEKLPSDKVLITELKVLASRSDEQTLTILGEVLDSNGFNEAFENLKQSTLIHVENDPVRQTRDNKTTFAITATI
ncbi:MAG: pilus assembly protein PilM [Candidatus Hydrogenedentes bacterium]|nr:pilus assembly protein PilM [Candidatus Hydrogenedentota bacterium]